MMVELLIVLLVLWLIFAGPGAGWGAYPRGGLLTIILVLVVLWFLFGAHSPRYYY